MPGAAAAARCSAALSTCVPLDIGTGTLVLDHRFPSTAAPNIPGKRALIACLPTLPSAHPFPINSGVMQRSLHKHANGVSMLILLTLVPGTRHRLDVSISSAAARALVLRAPLCGLQVGRGGEGGAALGSRQRPDALRAAHVALPAAVVLPLRAACPRLLLHNRACTQQIPFARAGFGSSAGTITGGDSLCARLRLPLRGQQELQRRTMPCAELAHCHGLGRGMGGRGDPCVAEGRCYEVSQVRRSTVWSGNCSVGSLIAGKLPGHA